MFKKNVCFLMPVLFASFCKPESANQHSISQEFSIPKKAESKLNFLSKLTKTGDFEVCLITQSEGSDTTWTRFVKQVVNNGVNTWIVFVNREKPGTFPESFRAKYRNVSYDLYEKESRVSDGQIKESEEKRELFKNQLLAASTSEQVNAVLKSIRTYELNARDENAKIQSCTGTDLTFLAYEDTGRLLKYLKLPGRKSLFDAEFLKPYPQVISKLNKAFTNGALNDHEFLQKTASYQDDRGQLRAVVIQNVPLVYHPKAFYTEDKYQLVLNHELGHVLGLLDVYAEFKGEKGGEEITLMGGYDETRGIPQNSDINGIFSALKLSEKGVAACSSGYEVYTKSDSALNEQYLFCKPKTKTPKPQENRPN